jgi:hypothetical protein
MWIFSEKREYLSRWKSNPREKTRQKFILGMAQVNKKEEGI